ncbi:hypothetical protein EPUL_006367, partial [Erysiphe pulchra]
MNSNNPVSNLYDPASPIPYDPYQPLIVSTDRPLTPKSVYPKFLDADDPGLNTQSSQYTLSYDEPPSSLGPIQAAIKSRKEAADGRVIEAETMFGTIAKILDQHCASNPHMSVRQANALKVFCDELVELASRHFEAYVRGISTQKPIPREQNKDKAAKNNTVLATNFKQSYASITKRDNITKPKAILQTKKKNPTSLQKQIINTQDERLFLRLPENSTLLTYTGYAVQTLIKAKLCADGSLLASVLLTKTGFSFCPSKGNSTALKNKRIEGNFFGDATIEQALPWVSYRISNVPRTYGAIDDNLQHCLKSVTSDAISAALAAVTGIPPVSVTPSRDNEAEPNSSETSWVVRFSDNNHLESNHKNLCAAQVGHICPPKYIHCHGAHPADDPKCLLRSHPSSAPKTRTQITTIRKICSEARLRIQAEACCVKISSANATLETTDNNDTNLQPPISNGA